MPALLELQRRFGSALVDGNTAAIEPYIRAAGMEPARCIAIYRNNWRENILAALAAAYPVLKRLVGDDYFRQMALEFQRHYPSSSGNLQHLGASLAKFLVERLARTEFRYFADIARLEWAYQETLVAADHGALDVQRLASVPPSRWPNLGLVLHPAIRLLRSDFPVLTIWSAHQRVADGEEATPIDDSIIDLSVGGENILLRRAAHEVEMRRLPRAEFAFLETLAHGSSLAAAADDASACDPTFDVAQALRRYVGIAAIVDFTAHAAPTLN